MSRVALGSQNGFTLVEVVVAIAVLMVGVLGAVTMIDGASAETSRTKAREGGTALARTVLEVSRSVPYADLTATRLLTELGNRAGLQDVEASTPGHQIRSRDFVYTVAPIVCSMDDPKDSLGDHDEVGISFCPDTDQISGTPATIDRNPDDYRRVRIDLTWAVDSSLTDSIAQTGIVTNPVGGLGPTVLTLTPDDPPFPIVESGELATYDVTTSVSAEDVGWSVNGHRIGSAVGADTVWNITWDLGPVDTPEYVDCTYVLQAEAFDQKGRTGAPRALTVTVNRRAPFAPGNFEGGPNLRGDDIDLQWDGNRECDIEGYVVYRGVGAGPVDGVVCEIDVGEQTRCVDEAPPAGDLTYEVAAIDRDSDGFERVGDRSEQIVVPEAFANDPPDPPATLSVCTGGAFATACDDIEGNAAPDGTAALSWPPATDPDGDEILFYRVYRDGTGYGDRLDVLFPVFDALGEPVTPLVFVDAPTSGSHDYWVTTVDAKFGESDPVGPVTWTP